STCGWRVGDARAVGLGAGAVPADHPAEPHDRRRGGTESNTRGDDGRARRRRGGPDPVALVSPPSLQGIGTGGRIGRSRGANPLVTGRPASNTLVVDAAPE